MNVNPLCVVVKIGTSSLTDANGAISKSSVVKLCSEVADLRANGHSVVVVSSGAIAAGLPHLGLDREREKIDMRTLQAASSVGQSKLVSLYSECLSEHNLVAGQVLLVPLDFLIRSQYLHAGATLLRLLDLGVVPIVNENDAIADDEIRWGDNDRIAALLANLVKADMLILLTDAAGVLTDDPKRSPDARLIESIDDVDCLADVKVGGPGTSRGSGGMSSKLTAARIAAWSGVQTVIADATRLNVLADSVDDKPGVVVGTRVRARNIRFPSRKLWIGFAVESDGFVHVDAGAQAALERSRSLLAIGVTKVEGEFDANRPVGVCAENGEVFAKGISRHNSRELRQCIGLRSDEMPEGYPNVVIHANDLFVLPT